MNRRSCLVLGVIALTASLFSSDVSIAAADPTDFPFYVGQGISDVTGPSAQIVFMGYAEPSQKGTGIQSRLRARAFIFAEAANPNKRAVFVSADICMTHESVKDGVVKKLKSHFGDDRYDYENVMISSIHTHSGPGGFSGFLLYDISTDGFVRENYNAIVDGITQSIIQADSKILAQPAKIKMNQGEILNASLNRSPQAYFNNEWSLINRFEHTTDKAATVLKIEGENDEIGCLNFFAVHCTSMNKTNTLISSDNKGYASYLFEQAKNPGVMPGRGPFVAAFAQSNEGDVSPNILNATCPDGTPCSRQDTCNDRSQGCTAKGPGEDMLESTEIIGQRQYDTVKALYESATDELEGTIDYRHMFVEMEDQTVGADFTHTGKEETTCKAAMGNSFAAGTIDGPGVFTFHQGEKEYTFWDTVANLLAEPPQDQIDCHSPKPILLYTGGMYTLGEHWTPSKVPVQLMRLGKLFIGAVPGEFTTMSGRLLRETIYEALVEGGMPADIVVVLAGLANSYTSYIADYREYQEQYYEGASTLYGPHTLARYRQVFHTLASAMANGTALEDGTGSEPVWETAVGLTPGVVLDYVPIWKSFGDTDTDTLGCYVDGQTAEVTFYGSNPRNDLFTGDSYCYVQKYQPSDNTWQTVCDDSCWNTKFVWNGGALSPSYITCQWEIPSFQEDGTYRMWAQGVSKVFSFSRKTWMGYSSNFTIDNSDKVSCLKIQLEHSAGPSTHGAPLSLAVVVAVMGLLLLN